MAAVPAPAPPPRPSHALVGDDDLARLAELTYRVARLGLTVSSAANRAEVWSAIHERPPDVVVLATRLALAQRADLLRRLARVGSAIRTPFVLVDGGDAAPSSAGAREQDGHGVLVYPCAWPELEATVRRVVRRHPPASLVDRAGPIAVDGAVDTVAVHGARVHVSTAELAFLRLLLQAPTGVPDAEVNARLWGGRITRRSRALVSLASRLRRKLVPLGVRLERAPTLRGYRLRW